jgi:streptogramin lyase
MKTKIVVALVAILCWRIEAQNYDTNGDYVQTFAGSGFSGYVDGVGQLTMFNSPNAIAIDSHNNLFVWDSGNHRIREIAPDSTVSTFAGGGNQITGVGTNVNFGTIVGMTIDYNNTIWMVGIDVYGLNAELYKITKDGAVTNTYLWSGVYPFGTGNGICADSLGNIYISEMAANKIYRYDTNNVLTVFAGSGNSGYIDGNGIFTAFSSPMALAADAANNIYVWDSGNYLVRKIDQMRNVTTFAGKYQNGSNADGVGTNAAFNSIYQMCLDDSGNLFLACGNCIRKIDATTNVVTLAGSFTQTGYTNGVGNLARFNGADGVCVSGGAIYVADSSNQRIRNITNNPTTQIVSPANLQLGTYAGLQITGIVGRTYQIQTSPDLNSWSTRATILLNSSPYLWIDQNPVSANKFYRALLLP